MIELSVITPTYNRRELLEKTAQGLMAQEFKDFEWVVVVDGSTDDSLQYLENLKKEVRFPMQVLDLSNGGQARARNAAIRAAVGKIILFCDDDLVLAPDCLMRHAKFHGNHVEAVAVGWVEYEDGFKFCSQHPTWVNMTGMNVSLQRGLAQKIGLFDETLSGYGGEDLEFGYRLQQAKVKFYALKNVWSRHLALHLRNEKKAESAGMQAVKILKKHGPSVGFALGVHPVVLFLKSFVFNALVDIFFINNPNYLFERAYARGARAELKNSKINMPEIKPEEKK